MVRCASIGFDIIEQVSLLGLLKNEAWGIRRVDFLEHPRFESLGGCPRPSFPNAGSFYLVVRAASTPFCRIYGPIASTQGVGRIAYYTAYLMGVPFYGVNQKAQTIEDIESSAAKTIFVGRGALIDLHLKNDKTFTRLDDGLFDSLKERLKAEVTVYINTKIENMAD